MRFKFQSAGKSLLLFGYYTGNKMQIYNLFLKFKNLFAQKISYLILNIRKNVPKHFRPCKKFT